VGLGGICGDAAVLERSADRRRDCGVALCRLVGLHRDFWTQLVAFALFRFFDAVKPGPVAWADELFHGFGWKGGFGIMLDDLVAAACTLLVIALWRF
jgi:phosphatidylglycerophosphatase A